MNTAALVGLVAVILILWNARFGLIFAILASAVGPAIGLFGLAEIDGSDGGYAWAFVAGTVVLGLGYLCSSPRIAHYATVPGWPTQPVWTGASRNGALSITVGVVSAGALYHVLASGSPLLSESIETARFDFTSSGFFGVPGRMYLYGLPIVWAMCTAAAYTQGVRLSRHGPWRVCTAAYLIASILGGFKSGLAGFLLSVGLGITVVTGVQPKIRLLARRWWWLGALAFGYLLWVTNLYSSYLRYGGDIAAALTDRVTTVGAEPKRLALIYGLDSARGGVFSDLQYFFRKYTAMGIDGLYSVERSISAEMVGVDPASDAWTTPVTVGGVPELIYAFGLIGGLVACALAGVVGGCLYRKSKVTFASLSIRAVGAIGFYTWMARGGLAYYALNYLVVGIMVAVLYQLAAAISGPHGPSHDGRAARRRAIAGAYSVRRATR